MWLIPYERAIISTDVSAEEAQKRLSSVILKDSFNPFRAPPPGSFVGRVGATDFRAVRKAFPGRYGPLISGKLLPTSS